MLSLKLTCKNFPWVQHFCVKAANLAGGTVALPLLSDTFSVHLPACVVMLLDIDVIDANQSGIHLECIARQKPCSSYKRHDFTSPCTNNLV